MDADTRRFSHDSAFKQLVADFRFDVVRWLLPEAEADLGPLVQVRILPTESRKYRLGERGRVVDAALRCVFRRRQLVVILVEHQRDRHKLNLYRLAHYLLALAEAHPGAPVVPIVVFADAARAHPALPRRLTVRYRGRTYLSFQCRVVRLRDIPASQARASSNPVLHLLLPAMKYPATERLNVALETYIWMGQHLDWALTQKYIDWVEVNAQLQPEEYPGLWAGLQKMEGQPKMSMIRQILMEQGLEKGREEGMFIERIRFSQRILGLPLSRASALKQLPLPELAAQARQLAARARRVAARVRKQK